MNSYIIILIPIIVVVLSQTVKILLSGQYERFSMKSLISDYGGMPSSHTAFLASLLTLLWITEGVTSPLFLASSIFSIIIIRDAMGLRKFIEQQSIAINRLTRKQKIRVKLLTEQVGHTPLEVLVGAIFGVLVTLTLYLLL